MTGKADYRPSVDALGNSYADRLIRFTTNTGSVVWEGRRGDVQGLFTERFFFIFRVWEVYHYGGGWPEPGTWTDQPPDIVSAVIAFEKHYQLNFSDKAMQRELWEALFERFNHLFKGMNNIAKAISRRR